jgi:hypothetical protein
MLLDSRGIAMSSRLIPWLDRGAFLELQRAAVRLMSGLLGGTLLSLPKLLLVLVRAFFGDGSLARRRVAFRGFHVVGGDRRRPPDEQFRMHDCLLWVKQGVFGG